MIFDLTIHRGIWDFIFCPFEIRVVLVGNIFVLQFNLFFNYFIGEGNKVLVWIHFLFSVFKIRKYSNFYIKCGNSYMKSMDWPYVLKLLKIF